MARFSRGALCVAVAGLLATAAAGDDRISRALDEVRDVKAEMFSRESSVLGKLPDPAENARRQRMARPVPPVRAIANPTVTIDPARAKKLTAEVPRRLGKLKKDNNGLPDSDPMGITGILVADDYLGRQDFLVTAVQPNTPAAGKIQPNDIILGANGQVLTDPEDPRPEMGYALAASQSPQLKGILTVHVLRDGKLMHIPMHLGSTTYWADTWPYDDVKTRQIRAAALKLVMEKGPPADGLFSRHKGGGFWTPLFLMASGDKAAMARVVQFMHATTKPASEYPAEPTGGNSWTTGYELINVAEYYLLTGDAAVLPRIRYLVRVLEKNQFPSGGWSHGAPPGYGEINNCGLACFIGLILARECGIQPDTMKFAKSVVYFGQYCGTNFPYGLGTPGGRSGRMDNGMHGMAAVAFHLLGEDGMAERWARPLCYMWLARERGHAEGIFSLAWGPIGASYAPRPEFSMFMKHMLWYYEFGRQPDGQLTFLRGTRFGDPGGMTPAMGLFLYLPEHRLRILGAPKRTVAGGDR